MTSHDAVSAVRRLLSTKKVGHTGTLDPNATGVLPLLVGNALKAADFLPSPHKIYRAGVRFGTAFDTEDVWGKVTEVSAARPDEAAFRAACRSMEGDSLQVPPMVSAVKVNGKKLYEYARAGQTVAREARPIRVSRIEILSFSPGEAQVRVTCSPGTYIRTLLCDICLACSCLGAMSGLCREESQGFTLSDSVTLAQLEAMDPAAREALIRPTEQILPYGRLTLPPFFDKLIANGLTVLQAKLKTPGLRPGERVRLYRDGVFFALGEAVDTPDGPALKKIKDFPPDRTEN